MDINVNRCLEEGSEHSRPGSAVLKKIGRKHHRPLKARIAIALSSNPAFQRVCAGMAEELQADFGLSDTERQALIEELVSHIAWGK